MPPETSAEPRLLFVVDNDFGALGTMMYFLHGQPLAARATLLLPRRVHELHGASLAVASRPYASVADILAAADAERPDLVLLASAYRLTAKNALGVGGVRELIRALAGRGCAVATTDPYLGTFAQVPAAALASRHEGSWRALSSSLRLRVYVRRTQPLVEGLAHFYPVPMPQPASGPKRFWFFNERYLRSDAELRDASATVSRLPGMRAGVPRWLFLLAQYDLELQERRHGRERFAGLVAARMRDAIDQGRDPTFIGPAPMVEALSRHFAGDPRVTLMSSCPFGEFEQRLLDAESAFYWQLFSTSTFLRLWNGRPVYFFDEGQNARLLAPMRAAGLERYFMGDVPAHVDIESRLDAAQLARHEAGFREAAIATRRKLSGAPSPPEMVAAILRA